MKRFLLTVFLLSFCLSLGKADEIDDAFNQWKATLEFSSKRLSEVLVLSFDRQKGVLTASKEFALNDQRKNGSLQAVAISVLNPEIELEGSPSLQEPWIKIRCKKNEKRVKNKSSVTVAGEAIPEVAKDEDKSFLVISCHRSDLKLAKEQGEKFLQLAANEKKPKNP